MKKERKFIFEKETKNTMRFTEQPPSGEPPIIGTLYVQKWFAGDSKELTVTIETNR